ncbi:MAG: hypothetical protein GX769_01450 [Erysipelothrix sp.]|nr:hypothetical protein [Erysipelothrix sp.]
MIDLHIKTSLSTGQMSVYRLLKTVEEENLVYFSIVDKNHALAYNLIEMAEHKNLITGTAINTHYKGMPIDLLGYDIDVDVINAWYDRNYTMQQVEWIERDRSKRIVEMLKSKGFELQVNYTRYDKLGITIKEIFDELIEKYPDFVFSNVRDFRLYGLNNPSHQYYIDQTMYLPEIDEAIAIIKKANGKVFLAHPFEYRVDISGLLEMVLEKHLDGIEVFHASISVLNSLKLIEFCETAKIMASIGSGYVGHEELIPLGVHLDEEILNKDCFNWIFNR